MTRIPAKPHLMVLSGSKGFERRKSRYSCVESLECVSLVDREESTRTSESSNGCPPFLEIFFLVVIEGVPYDRGSGGKLKVTVGPDRSIWDLI